MQLGKKVVVITGAGRGIGRAMALAFADRGADIAALDLDAAALAETRAQCEAKGVRTRTHVMDVTVESQVIKTFDAVVAELRGFDVLINNAGITRDALLVKAQDGAIHSKMSLAQWQAVIDVNLTGVFLCGREGAERMIQLGNGGLIVNVSSISREGNPGQTNYSAAKAGVAAMTVTWAKELARYGIRSAAIAPGFCSTEILAAMERLKVPRELASRYLNDGFSGGEKKRVEILQMAMLKPKIAVLDETDSGLDIDALRIVANGVNELVGPETGALVITHYQRILDYVTPDFVHVFVDGRIVAEGGPELAHKLEAEGYEAFGSNGNGRGPS